MSADAWVAIWQVVATATFFVMIVAAFRSDGHDRTHFLLFSILMLLQSGMLK